MRVLIAEDEPISARVMQALISPYAEYEHVKNGEEAFDRFCAAREEGRPFDLILLDIMMPEVDGQETLAAIRAYEEDLGLVQSDGVKVIMTTALDDSKNLYYAQSAGCTDYLCKPIDKEKLTKCLHKLGLIE